VDANLQPGDWAVLVRELNFLLSLYFMINICYYWIILPWKLSKAESFFKLLLLKKRHAVPSNSVPPIPMKSVLPQPELKQRLKGNSRAGKRTEDNYQQLVSKAEIEKEDPSEALYTSIPRTSITTCSSEGQSELEFDIDAGTRRSPKAVLRSIMSFSESCGRKNSINVNPGSLLPLSVSDGISKGNVPELEISDDEGNKEETNEILGRDEASENEDDFMLEREPTLFPSMPCSQRASIIEVDNMQDPVEAQRLSPQNGLKESSEVPSKSLSTTNIEEVFGVGFSETPDGKESSKRETATWNINDIPVL